MIGIEKVKSGEIFYNNQAITDDNFEKLRKDIGIVFQNPDNQFVGSIVNTMWHLDSKIMRFHMTKCIESQRSINKLIC